MLGMISRCVAFLDMVVGVLDFETLYLVVVILDFVALDFEAPYFEALEGVWRNSVLAREELRLTKYLFHFNPIFILGEEGTK